MNTENMNTENMNTENKLTKILLWALFAFVMIIWSIWLWFNEPGAIWGPSFVYFGMLYVIEYRDGIRNRD